MKVYELKYYYHDESRGWGQVSSCHAGLYASKDIAKKYAEKLVDEIKREMAYHQRCSKIYRDNRDKPSEAFKSQLDKALEMFKNGYTFEYTPEENERDIWIDDRYYPFMHLDDDELDCLKYEISQDEVGCDYDWEHEHYSIKEIEVIDEMPKDKADEYDPCDRCSRNLCFGCEHCNE